MAGDQNDDDAKAISFGPLRLSPPVAVVLMALLAGGGTSGLFYGLQPPSRPDPYTGTEGAADRAASSARDAELRRDYEREISLLSASLAVLRQDVERLQTYMANHRVESKEGFQRIEQTERRCEETRQMVKDHRHWPGE